MNRFLLFSLFACLFVSGGAVGQAADVKGLKLVQTHIFFGKSEVLLARSGIRVTNQGQFGYVLVSSAPEWKVTVFRTDDKTFDTESLDQFEQNGLVSDYHFSFRDRSFAAPACDFKIGGIPAKRISGPRLVFEYLPQSTVQPQIERITYGMYKLATQGGFPLTFRSFGSGKDWLTGEDNSKRLRTFLSTQEIERVVIDSAVFLVPKSFKKVDSMLEVLSSSRRRKETTSSFGDLFGK